MRIVINDFCCSKVICGKSSPDLSFRFHLHSGIILACLRKYNVLPYSLVRMYWKYMYSWHNKNKSLKYIRMYWTNLWQPTVRVQQNILWKFIAHIFTLLSAPFGSKLVTYLRHSESLNIRKNSKIEDIFLWYQRFVDFRTYFNDTLCL